MESVVFFVLLPKAAMVNYQRLRAMSFLQSIAGVCSRDVICINLPLYHTARLIGFTGAIERGMTATVFSTWSKSDFAYPDLLNRWKGENVSTTNVSQVLSFILLSPLLSVPNRISNRSTDAHMHWMSNVFVFCPWLPRSEGEPFGSTGIFRHVVTYSTYLPPLDHDS